MAGDLCEPGKRAGAVGHLVGLALQRQPLIRRQQSWLGRGYFGSITMAKLVHRDKLGMDALLKKRKGIVTL